MSDTSESVVVDYGRYACPVCGRGAESLAAKKTHIRRNHPRPKKLERVRDALNVTAAAKAQEPPA